DIARAVAPYGTDSCRGAGAAGGDDQRRKSAMVGAHIERGQYPYDPAHEPQASRIRRLGIGLVGALCRTAARQSGGTQSAGKQSSGSRRTEERSAAKRARGRRRNGEIARALGLGDG